MGLFYVHDVDASMAANNELRVGVHAMSKYCLIALFFLFVAAPASARFELRDPAAEMYEEQDKNAADRLAEKSCVQFLRDGADESKDYWYLVNTVQKAGGDEHSAAATESALKAWCIDHPKRNLLEAASATGMIKQGS